MEIIEKDMDNLEEMILQKEVKKNEKNKNVEDIEDKMEKNGDRDVEKDIELSETLVRGSKRV